ncbi:MAG TPA: lysophospholipid acyltransferase family protein [Chitinophagaceae bacterium]
MSFTKRVFGKVFAVWALLMFSLTLCIVALLVWIIGVWEEPRRSRVMHLIYRYWMRVFFFMTGVRLKLTGLEHFSPGVNYVVVYNHNSFFDVPVSVPFTPGANKTIAKIEVSKVPLFGIIYKRGSVLVDRKDEASRKTSYLKMKEVLAMGLHMCIYPEGTRNKTSEPLQKFHDGAFRLAIDTGKAILPALIFNTLHILPRKGFFFWPGTVELHYLAPIEPGDLSTNELKNRTFTIMRDYYVAHRLKIDK